MITLVRFGPAFGLPDPNPLALKIEILLRMAGLPHAVDSSRAALSRAKRKARIPCLLDDDVALGDATLVRLHLERKYGVDFDAGLDPAQRAKGWAFERLAEDHLVWALAYSRWVEDANFALLEAHLQSRLPPLVGPLVAALARLGARARLRRHDFGRLARDEVYAFGRRDLDAIAAALGDKPFLHGEEPKAADAALGGFLMAILCENFQGPLLEGARAHPALVAYAERIRERFFGTERASAA
jgi:glutathione S-transferase